MDDLAKTSNALPDIGESADWNSLSHAVLHRYAKTEAVFRPKYEAGTLARPVVMDNGYVVDGVSLAPYDGAGRAWTQRQQQLLAGLHARKHGQRALSATAETLPTEKALTKKIWDNRWSKDDRDPALACDWSQLRDRPPFTTEEMHYLCYEMTHSIRQLAKIYGCTDDEVAKLHVDCWRRAEIERDYHSGRMKGGFLIGAFYDCDRHNYRDVTPRSQKTPAAMYRFLADFDSALDCVLDYNCTLNNESYHTYGFTERRADYYAGILGKTPDMLIPFAKAIEWLVPNLAVPLTIPEPYASPAPAISDQELQEQLAQAPADSIDATWAQQELSARDEGRRFAKMKEKSMQFARQVQPQPQPLAERFRIAMMNDRIAPVHDEWAR